MSTPVDVDNDDASALASALVLTTDLNDVHLHGDAGADANAYVDGLKNFFGSTEAQDDGSK